jgi:hypothetical protein
MRIQIPETSIETVLSALRSLPGNDAPCYGVTLHADRRTLVISGGKNDDYASVPIVEAHVEGAPIAIGLNRQYFARALRFGLTQIGLIDPLSPLVFSNGGKRLIIMPLRLAEPAPTTTAKAEIPEVSTSVECIEATPVPAITQPNSPQFQPVANPESKNMNTEEKPQSAMQQIGEQIDQSGMA